MASVRYTSHRDGNTFRRIDIRGLRFGRWLVLELAGRKNNELLWKCRCDCGTIRSVVSSSLRRGTTKSCGCIVRNRAELARAAHRHKSPTIYSQFPSWLKSKKSENSSECWPWPWAKNGGGYGHMCVPGTGKHILAHRFSYELLRGPIPDGLELDHLCRNRCCVNPHHLEPVAQRVNLMRGMSPAAQFARRTHCNKGHPYPEIHSNTKKDGRNCRICAAQTQRDRRARLKTDNPSFLKEQDRRYWLKKRAKRLES